MSAQTGTLLEAFEGAAIAGRRREDPLMAAFERGRAEGLTEGVLAGRSEGLEQGRAEGFETGFAEGLNKGRVEGRESASNAQDATLAAIAEALKSLVEARADSERRFAAASAKVMRAAVAALLPRVGRHGLADEIAAATAEFCAAAALGEATLRVASDQEQVVSDALEQLSLDPTARVLVQADAKLSSAAARLEWRDGFLDFDAEACAARVIERLDGALTEIADPSPSAGMQESGSAATDLI